MKKYLLLFSIALLSFSACKKGDAIDQATIDDAKIQAFIAANYKTSNFVKDPSGLYYAVVKPGTGVNPTVASTVQVNYKGQYLNGAVFTQTSSTITQAISGFIKGWQIGLPHIKDGAGNASNAGRIMLIIPSGLAYGPAGNDGTGSGIPPNSVLMFTIDLIGVAN